MSRQHDRHTAGYRPPPPQAPSPAGDDTLLVGDPALDALLRHCPDGLLISGDRGHILFASQVAAEALGFESSEALMSASPDHLAHRFVIEEPSGAAAPEAPLPGHEVFHGLPEPDRLLRFRDPVQGWDRWALLRTAPSAKHIGHKSAVLTMVRDITDERRRETSALFLDEAGSRLGRSLSSDRVLEHAAVAAVPRLGDECVLIERQSEGELGPVAWHIPTNGGEDRAYALVQGFREAIAQVQARGRALLLAPTPTGTGGPGSGSMVLAPVTHDPKRREVLAVMLLAMAPDTGRRHHSSDLVLAEELGRRVSHALANAHLLEAEQRRRNLVEESESCARHLSEALEGRLGSLQRELEVQLAPLLRAAELLDRSSSGPQRRLVDVVRQQSERLRELALTLREAPPRLDTAEIAAVGTSRFRH